ncbi:RluA family pseudouridine synthase [Candidatus Coxiella mudrowiae]|uniref:RluA family pseudouridine synthase n=1 Tax=Candidatus Coxiella mudrowiae TaxID=2054173 RepID=UPI000C28890B|nr:RluA family pseudouridine synthase [Candidatus Coxiella mudrowiae]
MTLTCIIIYDSHAGQRLDNFLISRLKGMPSARIYRAIRKGEVRVNKKRASADYRLAIGDSVRIPPLHQSTIRKNPTPDKSLLISLEMRILVEEADFLVIDKPAGLPVHGGSGINGGLIEALRIMRPKNRSLELVHRLDLETSGCLVVSKKRSLLVALHALLTQRKVVKQYLLLVKGLWQGGERRVEAPLKKNILQSGERMVKVDENGKMALTLFRPIVSYSNATLLEARPLTGRTHQIRVHTAHMGHPIAGDEKYGDKVFNEKMKTLGLRRLFLHSAGIACCWDSRVLGVCALLDADLFHFLKILK